MSIYVLWMLAKVVDIHLSIRLATRLLMVVFRLSERMYLQTSTGQGNLQKRHHICIWIGWSRSQGTGSLWLGIYTGCKTWNPFSSVSIVLYTHILSQQIILCVLDILPEFVSSSQALSGPQNFIFWRRTVYVLCVVRSGPLGLSYCGLFL